MSNAEQPFYRRPVWIVVAIFLAVILVGGSIAAVTGVFGGGDDNNTAEPTTTPSATSELPAGAGSACGIGGYETENNLTTAPSATWKIVGNMATPQAEGVGPGETNEDGTFGTCFAHTPTGALFASINYLATSSDARNVGQLSELFAEGDFKDELEASPPPASDSGDTTRAQVSGFKIDSYTASEATVDLALTYTGGTEDGELLSLPVVVKWENGDWKVLITPNGAPVGPASLSSLGGYIPFSGV